MAKIGRYMIVKRECETRRKKQFTFADKCTNKLNRYLKGSKIFIPRFREWLIVRILGVTKLLPVTRLLHEVIKNSMKRCDFVQPDNNNNQLSIK